MLFDTRYKNRKVLSWRGRHFVYPVLSLPQGCSLSGRVGGKRPYFQRYLGLYFHSKVHVLAWNSVRLYVELPCGAVTLRLGVVPTTKLLCKC